MMKRNGKYNSWTVLILLALLASACGGKEEPSIKIAGISICVDEGVTEQNLSSATRTASDSIPSDSSSDATEVLNDFFLNQTWSPDGSYLWEFERVKTQEAWEWSEGQGVRVAVIDNGIDPYHKVFEGHIDLERSDFPFAFSGDDEDHGTHVAGTILGMAPHATFSFYHTTSNGCSDPGPKGAGMLTALARGDRVLNNSWKDSEHYGPNPEICNMVDAATSLGAIVIASAGNNGTNAFTQAPANCERALAVAATDYGDNAPSFSNTGEIGAPGVDIWSAFSGNTYGNLDGTSQAAPLVSGVVALLLSKNPDLTSEEVRQILRLSADKVSDKDFDAEIGYGRVNALKALEWNTPVCEANILSPTVNHYDENLEVTWHGGREYRNAWSIVEGTISIQGIANCPHSEFDHYELSYALGVEPAQEDWQVITEGYEETLEGNLDSLNADLLPQGEDGVYTLRLRVFDSEGNVFEDRNAIQIARAFITNYPKSISIQVESPITIRGLAKGDYSLQYSLDSIQWQSLTETKSGSASGILFENLDLCAPLGVFEGTVYLKLVVDSSAFGPVEDSIQLDLNCS
ncbi:MAG: S8/S53 family peptidase [Deltaproteobacteria bacterium]|nr:S8/S53 family peptidase [Deltaproteobacteria bacterium]